MPRRRIKITRINRKTPIIPAKVVEPVKEIIEEVVEPIVVEPIIEEPIVVEPIIEEPIIEELAKEKPKKKKADAKKKKATTSFFDN